MFLGRWVLVWCSKGRLKNSRWILWGNHQKSNLSKSVSICTFHRHFHFLKAISWSFLRSFNFLFLSFVKSLSICVEMPTFYNL
jgi:hypothetical protein